MWYRTGTITVTNGSTTVTGSGTSWIANAAIGEGILAPDNRIYEIVNIASDTSITLGSAYLGSNSSGQSYVIVPTQSYIRDLASQAATLINNYSTIYNTIGQGKFAEGTLGAPAISFQTDTDTGFYHSAANEVTFVAGGVAQFKYNTSGLIMLNGGGFVNLTTSGNTTLGDASTDTVTINGTTTHNAPVVVAANSSTDALRVTQVGSGNAILVEDSANPDSTPFVVDPSGRVIIGYTSNLSGYSLQVHNSNPVDMVRWDASTGGATSRFAKSRSGVVGTFGAVVSGDTLGTLAWHGDDGTQFVSAASVFAQVDGTPGTNDMPGRLVFSTTKDGASSPTERMRIDNAGHVGFSSSVLSTVSFRISIPIEGGATAYGGYWTGTIQPAVTTNAIYNSTFANTASNGGTPYTINNIRHYSVSQNAFNADSTVTNQYGYFADSTLTGASNNYGFYGNIAAGTGRYNFYAAGTADNYFAGNVGIGTTLPNAQLEVVANASTIAARSTAAAQLSAVIAAGSDYYSTPSYRGTYIAQYNASATGTTLGLSNAGLGVLNFQNVTNAAIQTNGSNILRIGTSGVTAINIANNQVVSLGGVPGAESLRVTPVASAVNYLTVNGAVTTGYPSIVASGSDTNIGLVLQAKGTGPLVTQSNSVQFQNTSSALQFSIVNTASAVNYLMAAGGTTGNAATLSALGSDTNIDLALTPKGTGNVKFGTFTTNADAPITGYITIKDSAGNLRKLAVIA